jgi:excinuclease ABC subunit B
LREEMFLAAENLQFEKAARLRDELRKLQGDTGHAPQAVAAAREPRGTAASKSSRRPAAKKRPRAR